LIDLISADIIMTAIHDEVNNSPITKAKCKQRSDVSNSPSTTFSVARLDGGSLPTFTSILPGTETLPSMTSRRTDRLVLHTEETISQGHNSPDHSESMVANTAGAPNRIGSQHHAEGSLTAKRRTRTNPSQYRQTPHQFSSHRRKNSRISFIAAPLIPRISSGRRPLSKVFYIKRKPVPIRSSPGDIKRASGLPSIGSVEASVPSSSAAHVTSKCGVAIDPLDITTKIEAMQQATIDLKGSPPEDLTPKPPTLKRRLEHMLNTHDLRKDSTLQKSFGKFKQLFHRSARPPKSAGSDGTG
jgi:hypothetical protein